MKRILTLTAAIVAILLLAKLSRGQEIVPTPDPMGRARSPTGRS